MLRIRELRIEKGWTQQTLAEKLHVSNKTVSAYETNGTTPPLDILIQMADVFSCSIDYLIGRSDDFGQVVVFDTKAEPLTTDEKSLFKNFRALSNERKMQVLEYAELLSDKQKQ